MSEIDEWEEICGGMSGHEGHGSDIMRGMERQLHAARYTFHKVTQTRYILEMQLGLTRDAAREKYNRAMENYDAIVAASVTGASHDANGASMALGFQIEH